MALDPYASCPCGSGKKFKWCCQPIHVQIDRAYRQDADGQHELALRLIDEVVAEHPNNPEVWGRKAELLYRNDRVEEAEASLQKAFELNPNYPFGHLLRGLFRFHEGEIVGALLQFRKAADYYDPEARDLLGQVYMFIAECELKLHRPVAAGAALRIALSCQPAAVELRQHLESTFGPKGGLPLAARQEYRFLSPSPAAAADRRTAWDRALAGVGKARLSAAARVFEELSNSDPEDAAAWYNLGLARAWLGDNVGALEALDRYVTLEPHAPKAAAAWALAEVLRQGYGMGEQSDHLLYVVGYEIRDPRPVEAILQDWQRGRRLLPVQVSKEQDVFTALILDTGPVFSATPGVTDLAPMAAYLLIAPGFVRLSGPVKERLERARAELEQKAGSGLSPLEGRVMTAPFTDVVSEAVVYPVGITDQKEALRRLQERVAQFFEGTWLQRPLRSLNGNAPIDAAGHAVLKKKLRGVVDFLQQCAEVGTLQGYDFDRVRRKLGLLETAAAASSGIPADLTALGAAELAALPIEAMSEQQLEQAFRTAQRLDATEVGTRLARALVARPPSPERADRYPVYNYLLQRAVADGQMDEALACINEGEKVDGEHNEGRRRNDYELRRAQLHARRAEPDASFEVFERLIQRDPENVKHRVAATEAMLALKQGPRAAKFAEEGLVQARKQNNRDAEQHLLELSAAARKLGG